MSNKRAPTNEEKEDFINLLASMSDEEINDYIKKNGKNNSKSKLFVFLWDNLKENGNNKKIIL